MYGGGFFLSFFLFFLVAWVAMLEEQRQCQKERMCEILDKQSRGAKGALLLQPSSALVTSLSPSRRS